YHDRVHRDTDQLGEKLTSVAVEQAAHGTRDTVPSVAVGAVGKQTKRQRAPCTATAPTGSSIRKRRSSSSTVHTTSSPAVTPIRTAAAGVTNAHGAVIATSPPSRPLQAIATSGLLY